MQTDLFSGIPLFTDLGNSEREDLRNLLVTKDFHPQDTIFWIGEPGDAFYIIESGKVQISYTNESGKEVPLALLGPGQFFGELSLIDGGRRTGTARAQCEIRVLVLGREQFHAFVKKHPTSAIHMMEILGRRQRDNLDKLRGIKNANQAVDEQRTRLQKVTERVAGIFASEAFLFFNLLFFAFWMVFQTRRYDSAVAEGKALPYNYLDAPPTFFWLGFMITVESILLSMFVLNSQKRQAQRDAIKADLDYQVNRKAQLEILHLHEKVDRLAATIAESSRKGA